MLDNQSEINKIFSALSIEDISDSTPDDEARKQETHSEKLKRTK